MHPRRQRVLTGPDDLPLRSHLNHRNALIRRMASHHGVAVGKALGSAGSLNSPPTSSLLVTFQTRLPGQIESLATLLPWVRDTRVLPLSRRMAVKQPVLSRAASQLRQDRSVEPRPPRPPACTPSLQTREMRDEIVSVFQLSRHAGLHMRIVRLPALRKFTHHRPRFGPTSSKAGPPFRHQRVSVTAGWFHSLILGDSVRRQTTPLARVTSSTRSDHARSTFPLGSTDPSRVPPRYSYTPAVHPH